MQNAAKSALALALCLFFFAAAEQGASQVNNSPDAYPGLSVNGALRRIAEKDLLLQTTSGKVLAFRLLAGTEFRSQDGKPVRDSLLHPGDGIAVYVSPDDVETALLVILRKSGSDAERQTASAPVAAPDTATPEAKDFAAAAPPKIASPAATGASGAQAPPTPVLVITRKVDPDYTPEALSAGLQGTVLLLLDVAPDGTVGNVRVRRGLGMGLDERAVAAATQWQYKPLPGKGAMMTPVEVSFRSASAGPWLLAGARFSLSQPSPVKGAFVGPVLSRYVSPDPAACPKDLVSVPVGLTVGTNGKPANVQVAPTIEDRVGKAAIEAVSSWQFRPATAGGNKEVSSGTVLLECGTPAASSGVFKVGNGVTPPSVLFKVDPSYSEEARKAKFSGSVLISLVVDTAGHAQDIRIVKSLGLGLDEEAIAAVTQWRFRPGMNGSQPVNVRAQIEVNFRLL